MVNSLGIRLLELRKKLNLTQTQIADKLNVSQSNYSKYEKDAIEAPYSFLTKCIYAYKVNPNWLLTGDGSMFLNAPASDEEDKPIIKNDKNKEIDYYIKRVHELEKQTNELKKNIQGIEDSYNQVTDNYSQERLKNSELYSKNQMLNDELTSRLKELIECKDLIIKLSSK